MADTRESATGVQDDSSDRAERLRLRALALAEEARIHAAQNPSASLGSRRGESQIVAALRSGRVPDLFLGSVWSKVRHPAVHEWTLPMGARLQTRTDPGPPNFRLLGHGLLIMGPVGTGKSSAAALCAREAVEIDKSALWTYVPDLLDRMGLGARQRDEEIRRQEGTGLLIWDDFGVRDAADWEVGYLDQIVDARYRARKPMIVTTNLTIPDLRADGRLARILDRWAERVCSTIVVLSGESMRTKQKGDE